MTRQEEYNELTQEEKKIMETQEFYQWNKFRLPISLNILSQHNISKTAIEPTMKNIMKLYLSGLNSKEAAEMEILGKVITN